MEISRTTSDFSSDPFPTIGAGPAGLACAIVLARGGRRVVVYERRKRPGGRFHNDFQGIENWSTESNILEELAHDGIEATFDLVPVREGIALDAWGTAHSIKSEDALYYLVRRGDEAGFQVSLAGFGITYALRSGILAAQSLLEGLDYTKLWRTELLPLLHTSVANRYVFNIAGKWGRRWAQSRISRSDAKKTLHRLYHPWWLSRAILPLALRRYRAPLKDKSCDHVNCRCVWCEHGLMDQKTHEES